MSPRPKQIFLFDLARHRSHLFFRFLGTHPDLHSIWHPFLPAFLFGPERVTQHTRNNDANDNEAVGEWTPSYGANTYAGDLAKFSDNIKKAKDQGKIPVANEHAPIVLKQDVMFALMRHQNIDIPKESNPTWIPDDIFASLTPVFVIRNPVFQVPSVYRTISEMSQMVLGGEDWKGMTALALQRRLFDLFRERDGKAPFVFDGDDVIWRTDEIRNKLASALSLTPDGISETWQPIPEEDRVDFPEIRYFLQTIDDSTGIEHPSERPPDADLDKAYADWVSSYGEKIAGVLRSTAEENIPHYNYMLQFKT